MEILTCENCGNIFNITENNSTCYCGKTQDANNGWKSLNGCGTCINISVCDKMGNCVLLNIDKIHPFGTKARRKIIKRLRLGFDLDSIENKYKNIVTDDRPQTINLTSFEKMCIKSLNKNRNN